MHVHFSTQKRLICTSIFCISATMAAPTYADVVVGDSTTDSIANTATDNVSGNLILGNQPTGNGTYTITGDTSQTTINFVPGGNGGNPNGALIIGNGGIGSFIQGTDLTDNNNQVNVAGDLTLGQQTNSVGTYLLNSGTLTVGGQLAVGGTSTNANSFTQNGGAVVLSGVANGPNASNTDYAPVGGAGFGPWGGALAVGGGIGNGDGSNSGGTGIYNLNGGTISTYNLLIGPTGTGTMTQTGGQVTTTFFTVGFSGTGTYNLQGGNTSTVNAYSEAVGYAGSGVFNQSGGLNTVATTLTVGQQYGPNSPGSGTYNLTGGTLTTGGNTVVGQGETGVFVLNDSSAAGTTHTVNGNLVVGALSISDGVNPQVAGTGSYTMSGNTFLNVQFVPGGNGPADPVGSNGFNNNDTNQPYAAPNGALIVGDSGIGTFRQGTPGGVDNPAVTIAGDLVLGNQAGSQGQYTLNSGSLQVDGKIVIGGASTGNNLFTQNGGSVSIAGNAYGNPDYVGVGSNDFTGWLNVGGGNNSLNNGAGTYVMNNGVLSSGGIGVGTSGVGTFNQVGGNVNTGTLWLGNCGGCNGSNSAGYYNLTGGTLTANSEAIGLFGHGEFVQNGVASVNTVNGDLQIATGPFPTPENGPITRSGSYVLAAGSLNTVNTIVGVQGVGSFTQNGGAHTISDTLTVGQQYTSNNGQVPVSFGGAAPGIYNMNGGTLTAHNAIILGGAAANQSNFTPVTTPGALDVAGGNGTFNQTGGSVTTGALIVGNQANGSGTYNLNSGTLNVSGAVTIQANPGSTGALNVAGGELTAGSVTNNGTLNYSGGSFTLNGGAGTLTNNTGSHLNLSGSGTRTVNGNLNNAGTVDLGAGTPVQLTATGNFTQGTGGTLQELIAGTSASQYSAMSIGGIVNLDGTLNLATGSGFNFASGQVFDLMSFAPGSLTGQFANIDFGSFVGNGNGVDIGNGLFIQALYNNSLGDIQLKVMPSPVPLPAAWSLMLTGLGLTGFMSKRGKKTALVGTLPDIAAA